MDPEQSDLGLYFLLSSGNSVCSALEYAADAKSRRPFQDKIVVGEGLNLGNQRYLF